MFAFPLLLSVTVAQSTDPTSEGASAAKLDRQWKQNQKILAHLANHGAGGAEDSAILQLPSSPDVLPPIVNPADSPGVSILYPRYCCSCTLKKSLPAEKSIRTKKSVSTGKRVKRKRV